MKYLGGISGTGVLALGDEPVGAADYELDGYLMPPGGISASGEIRAEPALLVQVFGRADLYLLTTDGQRLGLRFSDKELADRDDAAHVDVTSGLPEAKRWRS